MKNYKKLLTTLLFVIIFAWNYWLMSDVPENTLIATIILTIYMICFALYFQWIWEEKKEVKQT